jgi:cyanophycinase
MTAPRTRRSSTSTPPRRRTPSGRSVERATRTPNPGPVILIGGAEDKLRDRVILGRFVQLAGGPDARIVVVSTASSLGEAATDLYREVFGQLGVGHVSGLRPESREEANDAKAAATLARATGVFLTGGNQLRLTSVVDGTRLADALRTAHERGAVVAGTSAGASALAEHMMAFGASGATPKHRMATVSAGLGLVGGMVVDQHFEQRTRLGRLLAVVAQSPSLIGLGLDEDTAAVVHGDGILEVVGRGAVTIVDGRDVITDAFHTKGHRPMMVSGAVLHSIPSGYRFDLRSRTLLPQVAPVRDRSARAAERGAAKLQRMTARMATGRDAAASKRLRQDREASE